MKLCLELSDKYIESGSLGRRWTGLTRSQDTPRVRYESVYVAGKTPRVRNEIRDLLENILLILSIEELLDLGVHHRADEVLIVTGLFEPEILAKSLRDD